MKWFVVGAVILVLASTSSAPDGASEGTQQVMSDFYHVTTANVLEADAAKKILFDLLKIRPSSRNRTEPPPRHMLQLYEHFVSKQVPTEEAGMETVTVVRSIIPLPQLFRKTMIVFNISSLFSSEEVFSAHLHLKRRRLTRRGATRHRRRQALEPPMQVRLLQVSTSINRKRLVNIATYPVASSGRGWRILDVTAAVKEAAAMSPPGPSGPWHLGVRFEEPARKTRGRRRRPVPIPVSKFLESRCIDEHTAHLVLYSKDPEEVAEIYDGDEEHGLLEATGGHQTSDLDEDIFDKDDNDLVIMPLEMSGKPQRSQVDPIEAYYDVDNNIAGSERLFAEAYGRGKQRLGRSLGDNELPEEEEGLNVRDSMHGTPSEAADGVVQEENNATAPIGTPVELQVEESSAPQMAGPGWLGTGARKQEVRERCEDGSRAEECGLSALGSAGPGNKRGERRSTGRRKDEGRLNGEKGAWWNFGKPKNSHRKTEKSKAVSTSKTKTGEAKSKDYRKTVIGQKASVATWNGRGGSGTCSLRSYVIDFHELGWSRWMYGPRLFHSSVCTGSCPNSYSKDFYSTTQATIQGLLSALRRRDGKKNEDSEFSAMELEIKPSFGRNHRALLRYTSQEPCCVPNLFAPFSVLYVDDNEDIILRIFPRLRVLSCACV